MRKIKGIQKAVGEFQRYDSNSAFSPTFLVLLFDTESYSLWTEEYYRLGLNNWREFNSDTVVDLGSMMGERRIPINMKNVKEFVAKHF